MTSSDTFSFDNAAQAKVAECSSVNSSGMHSSPDGASSFSHVQSVSRSDSAKRSRPAIEDAEGESRPVGRIRVSAARTSRTLSVSRSGKTPSVRRMFPRPRSGESPRRRGDTLNADEELEARIRDFFFCSLLLG